MTVEDLDRLAALVSASEALSPAPWAGTASGVDDGRLTPIVIDAELAPVDAAAIIALRNAAPELLALAREAIAARTELPRLRELLRETERDRDYQRSRRPKPLFPGNPEDYR